MYPRARKIELFCRESIRGWATWGDEVDEPGFARQAKLFEEGA
jgi:N6-adenosine-specific RNA methylase IME4